MFIMLIGLVLSVALLCFSVYQLGYIQGQMDARDNK